LHNNICEYRRFKTTCNLEGREYIPLSYCLEKKGFTPDFSEDLMRAGAGLNPIRYVAYY
jgi:hypothetical protein